MSYSGCRRYVPSYRETSYHPDALESFFQRTGHGFLNTLLIIKPFYQMVFSTSVHIKSFVPKRDILLVSYQEAKSGKLAQCKIFLCQIVAIFLNKDFFCHLLSYI